MQSGNTRWRRAASGSNDGTVSWSNSMFIDTSGNVGIGQTSFGTNGKLQVTGGIGLTGTSVIRNSTNADDGSTLKFLGNQFVAGQNNSHSYSYSGGGLIASVSPSAGAILMDVGANSTSGHRLKVINGSNGADGSLQYLSGTTSRFHVDSASGDFLIGTTTTNAYRLEVYDGDYTTMMVRGPTYPTIRLKADNQNGGNNGAISIGASNALVLQPNNTTQGIAIENNGRLRSSTKQYYLSSTSGRGDHYVHTGGHHGAGTYTLFTMPANVTQSAGMVEIWWIYGTPSAAGYTKYLITGNKGITTLETSGLNGTGAIPTIAWSGQDLRVTNSNGSTYYHVRVTLHEIGNIWNPTWGNLSGIA
jgi:hypothetical protein